MQMKYCQIQSKTCGERIPASILDRLLWSIHISCEINNISYYHCPGCAGTVGAPWDGCYHSIFIWQTGCGDIYSTTWTICEGRNENEPRVPISATSIWCLELEDPRIGFALSSAYPCLYIDTKSNILLEWIIRGSTAEKPAAIQGMRRTPRVRIHV